jgi:hypothetical protein
MTRPLNVQRLALSYFHAAKPIAQPVPAGDR